ncbi:hypothetical protein GINT2_000669 [Glugoides intestinalis]
MLDDAMRFMARKIKKIEFLNTSYPQDYETINTEYRRLRDELDVLSAVIENFRNYEFGGSVMKNFTKLGNRLSSTTNLDIFKSSDIYTQAALLGEDLSNTTQNSSIKAIGAKFSEAYTKIKAAKDEMNSKLKEIQMSLNVLKDEEKSIDSLRKKTDDLRYELEGSIQEGDCSKAQTEARTSEFNSKAFEAMRGMKTFMGEVGVSGILKKIVLIHREFSETSHKILSSIQ